MGMFSWITSDTNESILVDGSVEVKMLAPDGRVWEETSYVGYGEFGGKDFYELVAELNGKGSDRLKGIALALSGNPDVIQPKLVSLSWDQSWENTEVSKSCPNQGFTTDDDDYDDVWDDWDDDDEDE